MEKQKINSERKENLSKTGVLVVITGASGAGKDVVMDGFLQNPLIESLNLKRVVTCTDRPPRLNETRDIQYHFVSNGDLKEMEKNGELVEPIKDYGLSNKATPKKEILRFVNGENLVWRIDPSLASEVVSGKFFKKEFPGGAEVLQKHTIVISVTAPKEVIENRRKRRDGDKYEHNLEDYEIRDKQDKEHLNTLQKDALTIQNLDGKLDEAINLSVKSAVEFYNKVKKNDEAKKR
jgi:guanylate kinase